MKGRSAGHAESPTDTGVDTDTTDTPVDTSEQPVLPLDPRGDPLDMTTEDLV